MSLWLTPMGRIAEHPKSLSGLGQHSWNVLMWTTVCQSLLRYGRDSSLGTWRNDLIGPGVVSPGLPSGEYSCFAALMVLCVTRWQWRLKQPNLEKQACLFQNDGKQQNEALAMFERYQLGMCRINHSKDPMMFWHGWFLFCRHLHKWYFGKHLQMVQSGFLFFIFAEFCGQPFWVWLHLVIKCYKWSQRIPKGRLKMLCWSWRPYVAWVSMGWGVQPRLCQAGNEKVEQTEAALQVPRVRFWWLVREIWMNSSAINGII